MKKEHICRAIVEIIKEKTEKYGLTIENRGTGKAFEGSFWEGLFKDDSDIPNIVAGNDDMRFELRSFWGCPELDIHMYAPDGDSSLMVLNYSDMAYRPKDIEDKLYVTDINRMIKSGLIKDMEFHKVPRDLGEEWGDGRTAIDCFCTFTVDEKEYSIRMSLDENKIKEIHSTGEAPMYEMKNYVAYWLNYDSSFEEAKQYLISNGKPKESFHTENFNVNEVRVDGYDYRSLINEIYGYIGRIEELCKEFEPEGKEQEESEVER